MTFFKARDWVDSPVALPANDVSTLCLLVPLARLDLALALEQLGLALRHLVRLEQRRAPIGTRGREEDVRAVAGRMSNTTAREAGCLVCAQIRTLLATLLGALSCVARAFCYQLAPEASNSCLVLPPSILSTFFI